MIAVSLIESFADPNDAATIIKSTNMISSNTI
jgi:hypothetical protein